MRSRYAFTSRLTVLTIALAVFVAAGAVAFPPATITDVTQNSFKVGGLDCGTQYRVTVEELPAGGSEVHTPTTQPCPTPTLWTGDFEEGNLNDLTLAGGGGEFNSGSGDTTATNTRAHSGAWSANARLATTNGGTRLFRWKEPRENRVFTASAWMYLPGNVTSRGNFWNVMQLKARSTTGLNEPIWHSDVSLTGGNYRLDMIWYGNSNAPRIDGPYAGMTQGWKRYTYLTNPAAAPNGQVNLPKDRWFKLTYRVKQSKDFDGYLQVLVDSTLAYDFQNVRTSYNNCAYNAWCTSNEWSVNNYSDGLQPAPVTVGLDDLQITTP